MPTKNKFFSQVIFAYFLLNVNQNFKEKMSKNSTRNQGFPYFFYLLMLGSGSGSSSESESVQIMTDPDPGGPITLEQSKENKPTKKKVWFWSPLEINTFWVGFNNQPGSGLNGSDQKQICSPPPVINEGCPFKTGHGIGRCREIEGIVCRRSVEGKRTGDLVQNSGTRLTHGGPIPVNIDSKKHFYFILFIHL
jgi:hypothetical protein